MFNALVDKRKILFLIRYGMIIQTRFRLVDLRVPRGLIILLAFVFAFDSDDVAALIFLHVAY